MQRRQDEARAVVADLLAEEAEVVEVADVVVPDAAQHVVERLATSALAGGREGLARRGGDEAGRVAVRLERPHVVVDRRQPGRVTGGAGFLHVLDSAGVDAELSGCEVPAARSGEQVVGDHSRHPISRSARSSITSPMSGHA